jgi:hypothetical protein
MPHGCSRGALSIKSLLIYRLFYRNPSTICKTFNIAKYEDLSIKIRISLEKLRFLLTYQVIKLALMTQNSLHNLEKIKRLAKIYFYLEKGELITNHEELVFLFKIEKQGHLHDGFSVYISRRSLKHFVESRKEEKQDLVLIEMILEKIRKTVEHFDWYKNELEERYFYSKEYDIGLKHKRMIRILLETKKGNLEIISMHFKRK